MFLERSEINSRDVARVLMHLNWCVLPSLRASSVINLRYRNPVVLEPVVGISGNLNLGVGNEVDF